MVINLQRVKNPDEDKYPFLVHGWMALAEQRADMWRVGGPADALVIAASRQPGEHVQMLPDDAVSAMRAGAALIIDYAGEVGPTGRANWEKLKAAMDERGLAGARVVVIQQNEKEASTAAAVCGENVRSVVFHYWMHKLRIEADGKRPLPRNMVKRFACLNHKMHGHRVKVLDWLKASGLMDKGHVSYTLDTGERVVLGSNGTTQAVPWDVHSEAGLCIVNETEMSAGWIQRFTEKILKPIATGNPFIVAGNPGVLKQLHALGFKTFAPIIDEAYDSIVDPEQRLDRVLSEAGYILGLSDDDFARFMAWTAPACEHNANHFVHGLPAIMETQHKAVLEAVRQTAYA